MCFGPDAEALWPSGRLLSAPMCRHKAFRYEPSRKYMQLNLSAIRVL